MTPFQCQRSLTLLDNIRRDLELYHPNWNVLGKLDKTLKEWKASAETLVGSPVSLSERNRRSVNNLLALALHSNPNISRGSSYSCK